MYKRQLYTYLHVGEGIFDLYGFATQGELGSFKQLDVYKRQKYMRSAFADIAGKNVLRSLAANALHGVVHRLRRLAQMCIRDSLTAASE